MECELTCKYCGYSWTDKYFYKAMKIECKKCKDKNIKIKELDTTSRDCFGYGEQEQPIKLDLDFTFLPDEDG